jgi:hypothetical protein
MSTASVSQVVPLPEQPRRKPKPKPTETEAQRLERLEAKRKQERDRHRQRKAAETKDQRKKRLRKEKAERLQLRQRLAEDDDAVWSFAEWCALTGVSERQGRDLLQSGDGPVVTRISARRIGITRRANREWQQSRSKSRP